MIIYIRKKYVYNGECFFEHSHHNFSSYNKAKKSIDLYVKELEQDLNQKVNIDKDVEYENKEVMYELNLSWNNYDNTLRKERFVIKREYVY